jgi:NTE family protein
VTTDQASGRIPVSLVLGSGGARGLAHIGVIRALRDDDRYVIESITGSSIGALIGGLHAAGKLDAYADWVGGLDRGDVWGLLDFSFTRKGLFEGQRVMQKLADMIGEARIEDLPIPFTAVASDIDRRREVWLNRGPLFEAIRASIAIPGLFTPIEIDGRMLVDGGLLSPLPLAPAQHHGKDQVIAVSLNGAADAAEQADGSGQDGSAPRRNVVGRWLRRVRRRLGAEAVGDSADAFDIVAQSIEAMQDRIARYQVASYRPDLLIEIPVNACGVLDFHCAGRMIDLGYRRTRAALDRGPGCADGGW